MGNIFDTSSVELTIRKSDHLGHLTDLANSGCFQNLPQGAVLGQYKIWLDRVFNVNADPKHSSVSVLQKI